jgi:hypothetical protein
MLNSGVDMTPPALAPQGVKFRFVDVVNAARLRGVRNLLIVDLSCAAVCGTTPSSLLRTLFPARTCVSLINAGLAGGGAAAPAKSRRRKSQRRRSRRRRRQGSKKIKKKSA